MYSAYLYTNKVNQKKYVGVTSRPIDIRKREHQNSEPDNLFHKAIKKYGIDSFDFEILETDIQDDMANEREQFYIEKYDSYYLSHNGYNMTKGGNGTIGYIFTDEVRNKISEKGTGRIFPESRNEKIKQAMIGRTITPEWRQKISSARTGKYSGENNPYYGNHHTEVENHKLRVSRNTSLIEMIDKNDDSVIMTFDGVSLASRWLIANGKSTALEGTINTQIENVCANRFQRKSCYGYKWRHKERCID